MNTESLNKIEEELTSKTNDLISYVSTHLQQINYPQQDIKENNSTAAPAPSFGKYGIGVGALLLVVGLATKIHIVTIGGGIVAAAGLFSLKRNNKPTGITKKSIDYSALTLSVYKRMEDIHTYVFNEWDRFLGSLKDSLKQQVQMSDFDTEKKNKIIDLALNRSVVKFSMPDVLTDLSKVEKEHDVEKYKTYSADFKQKYTNAIKAAYSEQLERYKKIAKFLD